MTAKERQQAEAIAAQMIAKYDELKQLSLSAQANCRKELDPQCTLMVAAGAASEAWHQALLLVSPLLRGGRP